MGRFEQRGNVTSVETSKTKKTAAVYRIDKSKSEHVVTWGNRVKTNCVFV